jgi:hypothetical protein
MAYDGANLSLLTGPIGGTGIQIWSYRTTDAAADIDAASYITDGLKRGMKVGDWVISCDTNDAALLISGHTVVTVSSTHPGVVNLSNGITVGGGSNTD